MTGAMLLALDDLDAFRTSEFQTSLLIGTAALVVGALCVSRRRRAGTGQLLGAVIPAAWLVALMVAFQPGAQLAVGIALLFFAGLLADTGHVPFPVGVALSSVGAWTACTAQTFPGLSPAVVFVLMVGSGIVLAAFAHAEQSAVIVIPIVFGSVCGVYLTVPDTEVVVVALGALAPLLFLAWPDIPVRLGAASSFSVGGLYVYAIAEGWGLRESAVVGALGALGLAIALPVALFASVELRKQWSERAWPAAVPRALIALTLHAALVLVSARGAGLRGSTPVAVLIVVAALAAGSAALVLLGHALAQRQAASSRVDQRSNDDVDLRATDDMTYDADPSAGRNERGATSDEPWS